MCLHFVGVKGHINLTQGEGGVELDRDTIGTSS